MFLTKDSQEIQNLSDEDLRILLGGKGAGLVQMINAGVNVPPFVVLPTTVWKEYSKAPKTTMKAISQEINSILTNFKKQIGYIPLVSIRSGARVSCPGMLDTILNVGLDITTQDFWMSKLGKECYENSLHRLVTMYGSVVKGIDRKELEQCTPAAAFELYQRRSGEVFPFVKYQIIGAIEAVLKSWNNERAKYYRKMHNIPETWGTAVVIQAMVFGNLNDQSGTGVLFTRNPDSGANAITGEFLINAQGEDVVAGIRTPMPLHKLAEWNKLVSDELASVVEKLEKSKQDVQDVEFTIQDGKLFILQTRNAKRSAKAAIRIALDMVKEGLISANVAVGRVTARDMDLVQMNVISPKFKNVPAFTGIGACSGVVTGVPVFSTADAVASKVPCILITQETTPEDIAGMDAAVGILTMTGGTTSHAAVVARGMNKPCVVGLGVGLSELANYAWEKVSICGETGRVWFMEVPVTNGSQNGDLAEFKAMVIAALGIIPVVTDPTTQCKEMMLDLSNETNIARAQLLVMKAAGMCEMLYVDFRKENLPEASQSFNRMYGSTTLEQSIVDAVCNQLQSVAPSGWEVHIKVMVSNGIKTTMPMIGTMDDIKSLILAKGSVVVGGEDLDAATKKVLEWKKAEGLELMSVGGYMPGVKSVLSIEQAMQIE
jgi:pyruvate,orthophosphate dikinase